MVNALFGPAGSSEDFLKKYRSSSDMPKYLKELGSGTKKVRRRKRNYLISSFSLFYIAFKC